MFRQLHLNMDVAVRTFLQNVDHLVQLPFISDSDMERLLGPEVVRACEVMSRINTHKRLCADCPKRCCPLVKCELYDPRFSRCPVFEFRPLICRMHFCDRFILNDRSFIGEFADIYVNALVEAKLQGSRMVDIIDSPPFAGYAAPFLEAIAPALKAFKEGRMDEKIALEIILAEAEKFRTPASAVENKEEPAETALLWEDIRESFYRY